MSALRILLASAAGFMLGVGAAPASAAGLEGHWANPKQTTIVNVRRCGPAPDYCAVVLKASEKSQANARKGGTMHFIGTQILRVHPAGEGLFKGKAFDPETNMNVSATVTMKGPGSMEVRGCAFFGLVCEAQRWTKVD